MPAGTGDLCIHAGSWRTHAQGVTRPEPGLRAPPAATGRWQKAEPLQPPSSFVLLLFPFLPSICRFAVGTLYLLTS